MAIETIGTAALEGLNQAAVETGLRGMELVHANLEQIMSHPDMNPVYEALDIPEIDVNPGLSETELVNQEGKVVAEVPAAEKELYDRIGLEMQEVNGRDVLIRNDIDPELVDARGRTNLERMEKGLAPIDETGREIELHHIRQNPDGPLAELTSREHEGNFKLLHPDLESPSAIDRTEFAKIRAEHWKERAQMMRMGMM